MSVYFQKRLKSRVFDLMVEFRAERRKIAKKVYIEMRTTYGEDHWRAKTMEFYEYLGVTQEELERISKLPQDDFDYVLLLILDRRQRSFWDWLDGQT